uniref:KIB1-4 beta-propeller domain-containing protein n=2 Tax=Aegilops tauschii TaxID=37682 RepID=A0A453ABV3_AEGTS
ANEEDDDRRAVYELRRSTGDSMIMEAIHCWDDEEVPYEPKDFVTVSWHFVESCGKLLMVRRQLQIPEYTIKFTRKVEVFEANVSAGGWVAVTSGLDGQALFISKRFCKSIAAHGEVQGDVIYFIDTGDMFNMRSQTMSPPTRDIDQRSSTWIFSSELVV